MPKESSRARAIPHLHRDRHGTFHLRLTIAGRTIKSSLGTKDRALATMKASRLNWEWSMTKRANEPSIESLLRAAADGAARKFDAEFPDGTRITGINTDDDLRRAKDLTVSRIEAIGPIPPEFRPLRPEYRQQPAPASPPRPFKKAFQPYLREKVKGAQNRKKTLADEKGHI